MQNINAYFIYFTHYVIHSNSKMRPVKLPPIKNTGDICLHTKLNIIQNESSLYSEIKNSSLNALTD